MTLDLDAIGRQADLTLAGAMLRTDVHNLIAEVRRLTAENQELLLRENCNGRHVTAYVETPSFSWDIP